MIDALPAALDFGPVIAGTKKDLVLMISGARGTASLTVSSLTVDSARFTLSAPPTPFSVAFGGQAPVTVRFTPDAAGPQTATLTIRSNASNQPTLAVALTGTGVAPGDYTLAVDDGGFESSVGYSTPGVNAMFLQRLTPPAYPATLKALRLWITGPPDGIPSNSVLGIFMAPLAGNPSSLDALTLSSMVRMVPSGQAERWVEFAVQQPLTITSGDFLVGFNIDSSTSARPAALDTTSPKKQAWVSTDSRTLRTMLDAFKLDGNLGLRAVVRVGNQ